MTAMQFALELGLKPLTALRQIAVVQGTPSLFGDLPLSLCFASGLVETINEFLVDKDGKEISVANGNTLAEAVGAVCQMRRKGDPNQIERFFTLEDAKRAGLGNSPTWKAYPKYMLKYRARSQALKDKFPDALNGVSIAEYDFNSKPAEDAPAIETTAREVGGAAALIERLDKRAPAPEQAQEVGQ